jgi:hypothetical protein
VRSKGGDIELLHFQTGSARLLPRLIAGPDHEPSLSPDRADRDRSNVLTLAGRDGIARVVRANRFMRMHPATA